VKFGPVPVAEALGAIAAHSVRVADRVLRKGTRIAESDIVALTGAGISQIVVARLEPEDISEDDAAAALAKKLAGNGVHVEPAFTGRSNLHAEVAGVFLVDREGVDRFNRVDEAVTFATLPAFKSVRAGEVIGTVKIIPFAIPRSVQQEALAAASPLVSIAPYRLKSVALVSTRLPGLAEKVIEKTVHVTLNRLAQAGAMITSEKRVDHAIAPLADAIKAAIRDKAELVIIFGASAIADRRDVIPMAIVEAGGIIEHFGMPVDPGNLMLIGSVGGKPVIGAPGCARSPKENGFDWLLMRLLAGMSVKRKDVTALGVGGLLMEIVTRPQPRENPPQPTHSRRYAAVMLAAGRGTRMMQENKLLAEVRGKPILRLAVEAVLSSKARPVIVVTGHESERIASALKSLEVQIVHNPNYDDGLSSSLKAGLAALPPDTDAVAVALGDMPEISGELIDRLAAAIHPERGTLIAVPVRDGKRGNPVVWSRRLFEELAKLEGDVGARHLIGLHSEAIAEVQVNDDGILLDIDTQEALAAARVRQ